MFAEARKSEMDLQELGERMAARKAELEDDEDVEGMPPPGSGRKQRSQVGRLLGGSR
jgi:hypothetical protein